MDDDIEEFVEFCDPDAKCVHGGRCELPALDKSTSMTDVEQKKRKRACCDDESNGAVHKRSKTESKVVHEESSAAPCTLVGVDPITKADLDRERKEFVTKRRSVPKLAKNLKPITWDEKTKRRMCELVSLTLIKQCERCPKGQAAKTPKRKNWNGVHPPPEVEHAMRHVEQNSPEWHASREKSTGASSLSTMWGWNGFKASNCVWLEDTGQVAEPAKDPEDMFCCDHGHSYEDEARKIAAVLLNCDIATTGAWVHPKYPFAHVSPDGRPDYPDAYECINAHTGANDMLRGLAEIKCSIYAVYQKELSVLRHGFPHYLQPGHAIQKMGQIATVTAEWSDYINYWHFNEQAGMSPLPGSLLGYSTTDGGKTFVQKVASKPILPDPSRIQNPQGRWLVAEIMVSRMYYSAEFGDEIYKRLISHMAFVRANKEPPKVFQLNSPKFKWVPLAHGVFYLTGSPGYLQQAKQLFDPYEIVRHIGSTAARPTSWFGEFPPRLQFEGQSFFWNKPVEVDLHILRDWGKNLTK